MLLSWMEERWVWMFKEKNKIPRDASVGKWFHCQIPSSGPVSTSLAHRRKMWRSTLDKTHFRQWSETMVFHFNRENVTTHNQITCVDSTIPQGNAENYQSLFLQRCAKTCSLTLKQWFSIRVHFAPHRILGDIGRHFYVMPQGWSRCGMLLASSEQKSRCC